MLGVPERFSDPGLRAQVNSLAIRMGQLESRLGAVEGHTAQLVKSTEDIQRHTARFSGYEATIKSLLVRGLFIVLGGIGGTYGVTRYTVPTQAPERTQVIKSATTIKVEACTAMQEGPERDQCALAILGELMGPKSR